MTETGQESSTSALASGAGLSVADRELIDDYVANRLAAGERDAFEARIVAEPALRRELELTDALREGLATLETRGELARLLAAERTHRRPGLAIAAAAVAGLAGLTALVLFQQLERARDGLARANLALQRATTTAPAGLVTLRLMQTRDAGAGPDLSWQRPARATMLDLRLDPGPSPAAAYAVRITRVQPPDDLLLLALERVATGEDGELALRVHSGLLAPGDYRVELEPAPDDAAAHSLQYSLRVLD